MALLGNIFIALIEAVSSVAKWKRYKRIAPKSGFTTGIAPKIKYYTSLASKIVQTILYVWCGKLNSNYIRYNAV